MRLTGEKAKELQEAGCIFEKIIPPHEKPYWHLINNEGVRMLIDEESNNILDESIRHEFLVMAKDRRFGSWSVQTWVGKEFKT